MDKLIPEVTSSLPALNALELFEAIHGRKIVDISAIDKGIGFLLDDGHMLIVHGICIFYLGRYQQAVIH